MEPDTTQRLIHHCVNDFLQLTENRPKTSCLINSLYLLKDAWSRMQHNPVPQNINIKVDLSSRLYFVQSKPRKWRHMNNPGLQPGAGTPLPVSARKGRYIPFLHNDQCAANSQMPPATLYYAPSELPISLGVHTTGCGPWLFILSRFATLLSERPPYHGLNRPQDPEQFRIVHQA